MGMGMDRGRDHELSGPLHHTQISIDDGAGTQLSAGPEDSPWGQSDSSWYLEAHGQQEHLHIIWEMRDGDVIPRSRDTGREILVIRAFTLPFLFRCTKYWPLPQHQACMNRKQSRDLELQYPLMSID